MSREEALGRNQSVRFGETLFELCEQLTRLSGREIRYDDLPPESYASALKERGVPGDVADFLAGIDAAVAQGALFDLSHDLSRLIGRPTTPLATTIAQALTDHRREKV